MSEADLDSGHIQLPTTIKAGKMKCSICGEESDGYHFGAEACRACAAFFRRSVYMGKKYVCHVYGKCPISSTIRCMCRACRYAKCVQMGMNPAGVQKRRDISDSHSTSKTSPKINPIGSTFLPVEQESNPAVPSCIVPSFETMPILERMRENYTKLENSRVVIHRRQGESLFTPKIPRNITHRESAQVLEKEIPLVIDWISSCFDDFASLPCEQKQILFKNFYITFVMLQGAFSCHINNREDVIIVASGDYIDLKNLEYFYRDCETRGAPQMISTEEAVKFFQQSFEYFRKALIHPMIKHKVDIYEFFALSTCVLWDYGLDEQSDECVEMGNNVKEKVLNELLFYLQNVRKVENPSVRVAMLVTIIPVLNRSVKKFQDDVEISNLFNLCAMPDKIHKMYIEKSFDTCIFCPNT